MWLRLKIFVVNHGKQGFILFKQARKRKRVKERQARATHQKSRKRGREARREPEPPVPSRHVDMTVG